MQTTDKITEQDATALSTFDKLALDYLVLEGPMTIKDVCDEVGIPARFATQIRQRLFALALIHSAPLGGSDVSEHGKAVSECYNGTWDR